MSASSHWQSYLFLYFPWPPISLRAVVKANPRPPGGFLFSFGFWGSSSASRPKAFTSLRLRKVGPLLIWMMTYLPGVSLPGEQANSKKRQNKKKHLVFLVFFSSSPETTICCGLAPVPSKVPSKVPPENFSLEEVGSWSEMRTSTFSVLLPHFPRRLKISTLWTFTRFP